MSAISNRLLFLTFLKVAVTILALNYVTGYILSRQEEGYKSFHESYLTNNSMLLVDKIITLENQTYTASTLGDAFVCLVDYTCVYSAYYDDITEPNPLIRIVAIDDPKISWPLLQCTYYDATLKIIGLPFPARRINSFYYYNNASEHSGLFYLCDLDIKNEGKPTYVFLSVNGSRPSPEVVQNQMLQIHYPPTFEKYRYRVAACVQPFHSGFDDVLQVLEWIEYLRLIEVEHFTFYDYTGGPEVSKLLETYDPELVSVMPWNIPVEEGLHVWGQPTAAADCAHRHRGVAKYVLAFDTDELPILPEGYGYQNIYEYLENLWATYEERKGKILNSIRFNSRFSFKNWTPDISMVPAVTRPERLGLRGVLETLNIPSRPNFLRGVQTKFVYKPEYVEESGIHWVNKGVNGTTSVKPPAEEAYYLHFRECSNYFQSPNQVLLNNAKCNQTQGVERDDYPALTFGSELLDAVTKRIYSSEELMVLFNVTRDSGS